MNASQRVLAPLDKAFNRMFSSQFNPLYRSGPIVVTLLMVAIVTGIYLTLFYRVGAPYESLLGIQSNGWGTRWIRSVHLYASDAAIVMIVFHVFRMIARGKTWGPRALAWVTGVGLLGGFLVAGWSGFVLVWDVQGQSVATAASSIIDASGILSDPIRRSFDGSTGDPPSSFFFLILFLHIVLPLGMIFGLWVHTSKISRVRWFPPRKFLYGLILAIVLAAVLLPFPLLNRADLLQIQKSVPLNWAYNFWIPAALSVPKVVLTLGFLLFLALALVPWWLRPSRKSETFTAKTKTSTLKTSIKVTAGRAALLRRSLRAGLRLGIGLLLLMGIAWVNRIPARVDSAESYLRLSWRLASQSLRTCVARSEAEIANLPAHMRTTEKCSYQSLSYQLKVSVNGEVFLKEIVQPGGMRGDRPLYVQRDLKLVPGTYQLNITFEPLVPEDQAATEVESGGTNSNQLTSLTYSGPAHIHAGRVTLVQADEQQGVLLINTLSYPAGDL